MTTFQTGIGLIYQPHDNVFKWFPTTAYDATGCSGYLYRFDSVYKNSSKNMRKFWRLKDEDLLKMVSRRIIQFIRGKRMNTRTDAGKQWSRHFPNGIGQDECVALIERAIDACKLQYVQDQTMDNDNDNDEQFECESENEDDDEESENESEGDEEDDDEYSEGDKYENESEGDDNDDDSDDAPQNMFAPIPPTVKMETQIRTTNPIYNKPTIQLTNMFTSAIMRPVNSLKASGNHLVNSITSAIMRPVNSLAASGNQLVNSITSSTTQSMNLITTLAMYPVTTIGNLSKCIVANKPVRAGVKTLPITFTNTAESHKLAHIKLQCKARNDKIAANRQLTCKTIKQHKILQAKFEFKLENMDLDITKPYLGRCTQFSPLHHRHNDPEEKKLQAIQDRLTRIYLQKTGRKID
jgi:hypothetical protein